MEWLQGSQCGHPPATAPAATTGHHSAVYSLSRNPFFPKYFLSVGDWTARVWNEDLRTPVSTTPYAPSHLTCGGWSPSRPGVFYTTSHAGVLDVWDYYFKQRAPVLSVRVADRPLTALAVASGGVGQAQRLAGVGCADGGVTLLQLSRGLVEMQDNEKVVIGSVGAAASLAAASSAQLSSPHGCA